jgi:putative nucleotidyltransferase with HDIG domain
MSAPHIPLPGLIEAAKQLPCAPWLLPKLIELLEDRDAAAEQIESLIKLDSGLATATLRLANSAYFGKAAPCETFNDAIVRLGFREIYRLASTEMAGRWLGHSVQGYGWEPGDLYRHSLTVAVAADLLAQQTGGADPEVAYTAGLIHDVGKLALAFVCGECFEDVRAYQAEERCAWRAAEHHVFGYDHTDVAGELLQTWNFPPSLVQVVRFYPRPSLADEEHRALVTHIHAAKHLALCIGTGVGEDGFHTEIDEAAMRSQGITPASLEALLPDVLMTSARLLEDQVPRAAS